MAIDPQMQAADVSSPWAELRRYEQAKEDGTAPEFSFDDLIDVVNPLQHIPVVSTIYREITGDEIAGAPRIVGGGIFGGVGGFVSGLVNAIAEEATGQDLGDHVMVAMGLSDGDSADTGGNQVAEGEAAAEQQLTAQNAAAAQTNAASTRSEKSPAPAAAEPARSAAASSQPAPTESAAAESAAAADDTQLTGQAALQALARDLRGGDSQKASEPTSQTASATPETAGANAAAAPQNFMPIRERDQAWGVGQRRTAAALRAEGDLIGSKRLQGAAPSSQAIKTQPSEQQSPETAASDTAPRADKPAAEPATAPERMLPASVGAPESGRSASPGEFADRMKRALEKYESLRNSN